MKFFGGKKKEKEDLKKVIAFGTFDIFHPGHAFYLKQAKKLGDFLTVVVARDKTVEKVKGQAPEQDEERRIEGVKQYCTANEVILGSLTDKYSVLADCQPSVIALGYDQEVDEEELLEKIKELGLSCKIKRIKAFKPEIYKSSKMKEV